MSEETDETTAVIVCSPTTWTAHVDSEVRNCRQCNQTVWVSGTSLKMEQEYTEGPVEFMCITCMATDMPEEAKSQPFRPVPGANEEIEKVVSEEDMALIRALQGMPISELMLPEAYAVMEQEERA